MCIHFSSLVVQEPQAGEDLLIIYFFRGIAADNVIIMRLQFRDLMPCHGSGFSRGRGCGRIHGTCIDALHMHCLNSWPGHYLLYLSTIGELAVKLRDGGGGG